MADRGKVLNVADVEVNTVMSTEDLVSGGDIRMDACRGRRRTDSRLRAGALPNAATSTLGNNRRRSTPIAITSDRRNVDV
jgi:hypothetical protein